MKNLISLLLLLSLAGTGEIAAQKWLNKLAKSVDKALDTTDKLLGSPTQQTSTTVGYESAVVKSFSSNVDFVIENCINDGKLLILDFQLINRGSKIELRQFAGNRNVLMPQVDTQFFDEQGNAYKLAFIQLGTNFRNGGTEVVLPEGVKMRGRIGIHKFNNKAKRIASATIAGCVYNSNNTQNSGYTPFSMSLKNISIYTSSQLLEKDKELLRKNEPSVGNSNDNSCLISSVVVTEKNTQVHFNYTGYIGYIYTGDWDDIYVTAGGKKYPITAAYGIAVTKYACEFYTGGARQDFTLVFEKIPTHTGSIDIFFDDLKWTKVKLSD
ncbi:MAG: hypothetical protein QM654_04560 [Dysgonamonadaceae bacterium]